MMETKKVPDVVVREAGGPSKGEKEVPGVDVGMRRRRAALAALSPLSHSTAAR
jgi:hypothetical protein